MYPDWYFKHYDDVFKRDNYKDEISKVNSIYPFVNKLVLEIGSGKGYHAEEIIKFNPQGLNLVDYQEEAFMFLKKNFANNSKIKLINLDAFKMSLRNKVDVALIFYSILPQVNSKSKFQNNIKYIFNNLIKRNGVLAFEYIDYDISGEVFPENQTSLLVKQKEIKVYIKSSYLNDRILIKYFGTFKNTPLKYDVSLLRLNNLILEEIVTKLGLEQFATISLDKEERRKMIFIRESNAK